MRLRSPHALPLFLALLLGSCTTGSPELEQQAQAFTGDSAWIAPQVDPPLALHFYDRTGNGQEELAVGLTATPTQIYSFAFTELGVAASQSGLFFSFESVEMVDLDLDANPANGTEIVTIEAGSLTGYFGPLAIETRIPPSGSVRGVLVDDLDGDGDEDLLVAEGDGLVFLRIIPGDGFEEPITFPLIVDRMTGGNFDGVGVSEFATITGGAVEICFLDGGVFCFSDGPGFDVSSVTDATEIAWGDWNGDGQDDLAIARASGGFEIHTGPPASSPGVLPVETAVLTDLVWADWNGDGREDLSYLRASGERVHLFSTEDGMKLAAVSLPFGELAMAFGDWDGDGDLDLATATEFEVFVYQHDDTDGDGFPDSMDCAPEDAAVSPAAVEACNGVDDDCDGFIPFDERDVDADGAVPCSPWEGDPGLYGGDCDDDDFARDPDNPELCGDGIDNDCDDGVDDFVADVDGDGFNSLDSCIDPVDCDDEDPDRRPDAAESCNGIDDDCDGALPEGEADDDGDGFRVCEDDCDDAAPLVYPGAPDVCDGVDSDCGGVDATELDTDGDGALPCAGDCDDTDPTSLPGAPELCDQRDNDCDGILPTDELDNDDDTLTPCAGDCDDTDATVFSGASELCDGVDNDCDGALPPGESDADGDGARLCDGDCDDTDPTRGPLAEELCDGIDGDCDGFIPAEEGDADGDGFRVCEGDCADLDELRFPGADEGCNGLDNDCDGVVPDEEIDADGDGMSPCAGDCDDTDPVVSAAQEELCDGRDNDCSGVADDLPDLDGDGFAPCEGDCDDSAPLTFPGAPELCDGLDNDCDGRVTDEEDDEDGDGVSPCDGDCDDADAERSPLLEDRCDGIETDCDPLQPDEFDDDEDGFVACDTWEGAEPTPGVGDCVDSDPAISPAAEEFCNGLDDNCDGFLLDDEIDFDGDGFAPCQGDCNDADPAVNPAAFELCDPEDIDENCDGDPGSGQDRDGDGFADCATSRGRWDCDDEDPGFNPAAIEVCDFQDEDCDGEVDENFDEDSDGWTSCAGDCRDDSPLINPAAVEVCNSGVDENCDGRDSPGADTDSDRFSDCAENQEAEWDCNDEIRPINPGAAEYCSGRDENCNGLIDEGFDSDGDGWLDCRGDCGPDDPLIYPGAPERCDDAIDQDCDRVVNEDCAPASLPPGCVCSQSDPTRASGWLALLALPLYSALRRRAGR